MSGIEYFLNCILFTKVEILSNGTLIVDGGHGKTEGVSSGVKLFGGGGGGVIQIISSESNISAHSLSVRHGSPIGRHGRDCDEANGYYYLQGMECNYRS